MTLSPNTSTKLSKTPGPSESPNNENSKDKSQKDNDNIKPNIHNANRHPPKLCSNDLKHLPNALAVLNGTVIATGFRSVYTYKDIRKDHWPKTYEKHQPKASEKSSSTSPNSESITALHAIQGKDDKHILWIGFSNGRVITYRTIDNVQVDTRQFDSTKEDKSAVIFCTAVGDYIWIINQAGKLLICESGECIRERGKADVMSEATSIATFEDARTNTAYLFMTQEEGGISVYSSPLHDPSNQKISAKKISAKHLGPKLSNIISMTVLPYYGNKNEPHLLCAHRNQISVWNMRIFTEGSCIESGRIIDTPPSRKITCMTTTLGHFVWVGSKSGFIQVYDIEREWKLIKEWKAHNKKAVKMLKADESALQNGKAIVVSIDEDKKIAVWDGLLEEQWKAERFEEDAKDIYEYKERTVSICSWNLNAISPSEIGGESNKVPQEVKEWLGASKEFAKNPEVKESPKSDIIVIGLQEIIDLESKRQNALTLWDKHRQHRDQHKKQDEARKLSSLYREWLKLLTSLLNYIYGDHVYKLFWTEQLVGLCIIVFVREEIYNECEEPGSTVVKMGMRVMNKSLHGNKGAVLVRFLLDNTSLCFVNCHLAAGHSNVVARNVDAESIFKKGEFKDRKKIDEHSLVLGGDGTNPLDYEYCFVSGDLNYRVEDNGTKNGTENVTKRIKEFINEPKSCYRQLYENDQLHAQRQDKFFILSSFEEQDIQFAPTYKYNINSEKFDTSSKKRIPAWCDRILYRSASPVVGTLYDSYDVRYSDHRPIRATFTIQTKKITDDKKKNIEKNIKDKWTDHLKTIKESAESRQMVRSNPQPQKQTQPQQMSMGSHSRAESQKSIHGSTSPVSRLQVVPSTQ